MEYLIDNPSVAREMGNSAREHIQHNYDRNVQITKLYELLNHAAGVRQETSVGIAEG